MYVGYCRTKCCTSTERERIARYSALPKDRIQKKFNTDCRDKLVSAAASVPLGFR